MIKKSIAIPTPGMTPALPLLLVIQRRLNHFAPALCPFLDSLPLPFQWAVPETEDHTEDHQKLTRMAIHLVPEAALELAEQHKVAANWAYSRRMQRIALMEYTEALGILRFPLLSSHPAAVAVMPRVKRLLVVCFANRAAVSLQDGELKNAALALEDGKRAEMADAAYGKRYVR